jgi:hypothetical protein
MLFLVSSWNGKRNKASPKERFRDRHGVLNLDEIFVQDDNDGSDATFLTLKGETAASKVDTAVLST